MRKIIIFIFIILLLLGLSGCNDSKLKLYTVHFSDETELQFCAYDTLETGDGGVLFLSEDFTDVGRVKEYKYITSVSVKECP